MKVYLENHRGEVEEMSQLGCMDSVNKLQKQKKGLWSLGEGMQRYVPEGKRGGKGQACSQESSPEERRGRVKVWACSRSSFYLLYKGGNFRGGLRGGCNRIFISFPGVSGSWSPLIGS